MLLNPDRFDWVYDLMVFLVLVIAMLGTLVYSMVTLSKLIDAYEEEDK